MKLTQIQIDYASPTFPGGLSVKDLQSIMQSMDWTDGAAVAKQTVRCNNRCNGNDVDVQVPVARVSLK